MLAATFTMTIFGIFLVMTGASLFAFIIAKRLRDPNQQAHGTGKKLCSNLGLTHNDRGMLQSIADNANMPGLVPILISRGCFDHVVSAFNPHGADAHHIRAIRKRLFSTSSIVKK